MKREDTYIDVFMAENNIRTDKELANLLNMKQQALSSRLKKISLETLELLAEVFEKPVKELLK